MKRGARQNTTSKRAAIGGQQQPRFETARAVLECCSNAAAAAAAAAAAGGAERWARGGGQLLGSCWAKITEVWFRPICYIHYAPLAALHRGVLFLALFLYRSTEWLASLWGLSGPKSQIAEPVHRLERKAIFFKFFVACSHIQGWRVSYEPFSCSIFKCSASASRLPSLLPATASEHGSLLLLLHLLLPLLFPPPLPLRALAAAFPAASAAATHLFTPRSNALFEMPLSRPPPDAAQASCSAARLCLNASGEEAGGWDADIQGR